MSTPIPIVRKALHLLADQIGGPEGAELHYWAEETWRRSPSSRAPSKPPVYVPRHVLLTYKAAHPDATNHEIAVAFGMRNCGRVTDAIRGKLR